MFGVHLVFVRVKDCGALIEVSKNIKGLKISKKFYESYDFDMLTKNFSELIPKMAIGLIGQGSEYLGYDDEISKEHDFEPGFCIFIPDEFDDNLKFNLERTYSYLTKEFMGLKRDIMSPVGDNRHGVIRILYLYIKELALKME